MEKTSKCKTCQTTQLLTELCDCKRNSLVFFKILQQVQSRVSTSKPTSTNNEIELIRAGIDKVNGNFKDQPLATTICANAKSLGATFEHITFKDRKCYIEINYNSSTIHLGLDYTKSFVTTLVSNPNRFNSWSNYIHLLEQIIPADSLESLQISRVDLNLDYNCTFEKLIESIDVKNKRNVTSFNDASGIRTGMNIGKGQSYIVIYDKALKGKLEYNLSRIELRLSGKMLPTNILKQLPKYLIEKDYFTEIEAHHLEVQKTALLDDQKKRLAEFEMLTRREGFYSARKKLNLNKNFDRDFKNLINLNKWIIQPSEAFKNYISSIISLQNSTETIH